MSDLIHIDDLHVRCIIGINPDERVNRQDVFISLTLETDTQAAAASDDIADAVNYRTLTKEVFEMVEASQFLLVERMAEEIAKLSLRDERVRAVRVRVDKPGALRFARSVAVEVERVRDEQSSE